MNLKTQSAIMWIFFLCFTWVINYFGQLFKMNDIYYLGIGGVITFAVTTWYDKKKLERKLQNYTGVKQ